MLDKLRSLLFNFFFYGGSLVLLLAAFPLWFASKAIQRKFCLVWVRYAYWCEKYVLGLDYRVVGRENLPSEPPYLVAMKHQSAWETMKLYALFGFPAIVLKKELMDMFLWGRYARAMDMVPVDRSRGREAMDGMVQSARRILTEKRPLVIFPQGTRIPVGVKKPYKHGIAKLYEDLQLPVVPIALNSGVFWPKKSFWKKSGTITLEVMPPIMPGIDGAQMLAQLEQQIESASDRLAQNL